MCCLMSDLKPIHDNEMSSPGFDIFFPEERTVPFVFNSPHSGRHYPIHFLKQSRLSPHLLRRSEDVLVDHLFNFVPTLGAPLMAATFPRAYVDVNREPFELDPKLFQSPLPESTNSNSLRVMAGLGTIARVVGEGMEIYREPLKIEEGFWRISNFYLPYHRRLNDLINENLSRFDMAVLIDCHSMPSNQSMVEKEIKPDFVIGDRYGRSANSDLVSLLVTLLRNEGFWVETNIPYAGGYITEHYGNPSEGIHAIQVEINRALYIDEEQLDPHEGFSRLAKALETVFTSFVCEISDPIRSICRAAE